MLGSHEHKAARLSAAVSRSDPDVECGKRRFGCSGSSGIGCFNEDVLLVVCKVSGDSLGLLSGCCE